VRVRWSGASRPPCFCFERGDLQPAPATTGMRSSTLNKSMLPQAPLLCVPSCLPRPFRGPLPTRDHLRDTTGGGEQGAAGATLSQWTWKSCERRRPSASPLLSFLLGSLASHPSCCFPLPTFWFDPKDYPFPPHNPTHIHHRRSTLLFFSKHEVPDLCHRRGHGLGLPGPCPHAHAHPRPRKYSVLSLLLSLCSACDWKVYCRDASLFSLEWLEQPQAQGAGRGRMEGLQCCGCEASYRSICLLLLLLEEKHPYITHCFLMSLNSSAHALTYPSPPPLLDPSFPPHRCTWPTRPPSTTTSAPSPSPSPPSPRT